MLEFENSTIIYLDEIQESGITNWESVLILDPRKNLFFADSNYLINSVEKGILLGVIVKKIHTKTIGFCGFNR